MVTELDRSLRIVDGFVAVLKRGVERSESYFRFDKKDKARQVIVVERDKYSPIAKKRYKYSQLMEYMLHTLVV